MRSFVRSSCLVLEPPGWFPVAKRAWLQLDLMKVFVKLFRCLQAIIGDYLSLSLSLSLSILCISSL